MLNVAKGSVRRRNERAKANQIDPVPSSLMKSPPYETRKTGLGLVERGKKENLDHKLTNHSMERTVLVPDRQAPGSIFSCRK